jgi:hypothetical protein
VLGVPPVGTTPPFGSVGLQPSEQIQAMATSHEAAPDALREQAAAFARTVVSVIEALRLGSRLTALSRELNRVSIAFPLEPRLISKTRFGRENAAFRQAPDVRG